MTLVEVLMLSKLGLVVSLLVGTALATPQLAFPINAQFPPVAYVSQPYKFEFAVTTFVSTLPQLVYTITDAPKWLVFDSASRVLTGTPLSKDVGTNTFKLTAADSTGEAATTITLIVLSELSVLTTNSPVLPPLKKAGPVSAPQSLILHPSQPFEVVFPPETFLGTDSSTNYYAASQNHSPLPSWIEFDPSQLSFKGTSPPLIPPSPAPQTYGFVMMASNIPDFTQAMIQFDIIVTDNALAFTTPVQQYNISSNVRFETPPLRSSLLLNGEAITDGQIANVTTNAPGWLKLDKRQITLSGSPPAAADINVTISVTDTYNDIANTTIQLQHGGHIAMSIGRIASVRINLGQEFSYSVNNSEFAGPGQMTIDLGTMSSWLHFDAQRRILSGYPPLDLPYNTINIPVTFRNVTMDIMGTVDLQPVLMKTKASGTSMSGTQPTSTTTPSKTDISHSTAARPSTNPSRHVTTIILAMLAVACGLLTILCLVLWIMKRRREKIQDVGEQEQEHYLGDNQRGEEATTERAEPPSNTPLPVQLINSQEAGPVPPPNVDLTWKSDVTGRPRHGSPGRANLPSAQAPRSTYTGGPLDNHPVRGSFPNTGALRKQVPPSRQEARNSVPQEPSVSKIDVNKRESLIPVRQLRLQSIIGLPNRRSGAGHGTGVLVYSEADNEHETRTTQTPVESRRTTMVLDSFPNPPHDISRTTKVPPLNNSAGPSLHTSEDSNLTFEVRRQQWHTERARAQLEGGARFSNAGSSFVPRGPRDRTGKHAAARHTKPLSLLSSYEENDRPTSRKPSWSRWSGTGPAAHDAFRSASPLDSLTENLPQPGRCAGFTSAGQFDSAASSDSQWEFEDLVDEDTNGATRQWQTNRKPATTPRLPFDTVPSSRQSTSSEVPPTRPSRARLSDVRRKHASVADGELKTYQSQYGNFRFI
ncbi:polarity establishment/cellular polarization [Knufia peltigerae]|uniref:Polarity establishment/cellular polarization n=1 Tax=Knufia peltigerae TaxID=1002370 RepID=A0AA38Y6U5_9EURO|nr:polarity establishment/cellular polarization [Knufia peltigerae]